MEVIELNKLRKIYSLGSDTKLNLGFLDKFTFHPFLGTQIFYDEYKFHWYHSFDLTSLHCHMAAVLTLTAQRPATIRNVIFTLSFNRTSNSTYFWRYNNENISPDIKELIAFQGTEICTESCISAKEWNLMSLGMTLGKSWRMCMNHLSKKGLSTSFYSFHCNKNWISTYCFQWFGFF